jgi:hypothetical protein
VVSEQLSASGMNHVYVPLSGSFVGNESVELSVPLTNVSVKSKQLSGNFIGNGDVNLSAPLTTIHVEPEPLSRAFVGNGDNVITALVKPRFQDIRCIYDANSNGTTERAEALSAVTSYLLSLTDITRDEAVEVVTSYLLSQSFEC